MLLKDSFSLVDPHGANFSTFTSVTYTEKMVSSSSFNFEFVSNMVRMYVLGFCKYLHHPTLHKSWQSYICETIAFMYKIDPRPHTVSETVLVCRSSSPHISHPFMRLSTTVAGSITLLSPRDHIWVYVNSSAAGSSSKILDLELNFDINSLQSSRRFASVHLVKRPFLLRDAIVNERYRDSSRYNVADFFPTSENI